MYIALKKRKWPMRITTFENEELNKHSKKITYGCGAGRGRLAIDARGDLYGCGKMANTSQSGQEILPLGNVFQGFTRMQNRDDLQDSTAQRRIKCRSCTDNGKCSGGCPAINGEATGSIFAPFDGCLKKNENYAKIVEHIIRRKREDGLSGD